MRITSKEIHSEENQGKITIETAGTVRATFTQSGTVIWASSATDQSGVRLVGTAGGLASITAASAATASGTSGFTQVIIPHSMGLTPTNFDAAPANTQAALAGLLGTYLTADGTNIYVTTTTAVSASSSGASKIYNYQWWATP